MPVVDCICGSKTNSAISNYWLRGDGDKAKGCYAKFDENNVWSKGCAYKKGSKYNRHSADGIIKAMNNRKEK